jgi:pimeloyl-ACP methyl ester carboxylesterase
MMAHPDRRRAVRETLGATRQGLPERMGSVRAPTLVVMGGADSHFSDPHAEGASVAATTRGALLVVPDAGHYPHVEFPDQVGAAIADFLVESPA